MVYCRWTVQTTWKELYQKDERLMKSVEKRRLKFYVETCPGWMTDTNGIDIHQTTHPESLTNGSKKSEKTSERIRLIGKDVSNQTKFRSQIGKFRVSTADGQRKEGNLTEKECRNFGLQNDIQSFRNYLTRSLITLNEILYIIIDIKFNN